MEWIKVEDKLPEIQGMYHVVRRWSKRLTAVGHTYWDGDTWKSGDMDYIAGPIISWMPLTAKEKLNEKSSQM